MLIEFFILFEIITVVTFFIAFFTKQEIIWGLSSILSGIMMFSSWSVEMDTFFYNTTGNIIVPTVTSFSYPYLFGINMIFFSLSLLLLLFDMFDKYGVTSK